MMPNAQEKAGTSNLISLSDEAAVKEVLGSTLLGLWDIVNNLSRIRPTKRDRYRVAIFGSARALPGSFVYNEVKRSAAALAEMGCDIVTGGGPGLMQAANEGAASIGKPDRSTGIRIDLPFEQDVNPYVEQMFQHKTFFSRLQHFVLTADAFVVVPGGIGTVLEMLMIWQLLQVKHVEKVPLILVGEMWEKFVEWAKISMLDPKLTMASPEDFEIPRCFRTADDALAAVRVLHTEWLAHQSSSGAKPSP